MDISKRSIVTVVRLYYVPYTSEEWLMLLDSFWHLCTGDKPFLVDYLLGVIVARYEVYYMNRLWNGSWFVQCVTGFCWRSNFKKCRECMPKVCKQGRTKLDSMLESRICTHPCSI